ncbi:MAG: hypothetical protein JJE17_01660 [Peptostreptococcaceae bacterium]|nr:hypothetical protein [Peptostreptococcaceae bacterium]
MGYAGKILVGAFIGVGAIAAAPFTGGGSVLAGATLASSLLGAGGVAAVVSIAGGAAGAAVQKSEDNLKEKDVRNAKTSSFQDGMKEGKKETVEEIMKFADFYLATTALSYYFARCDGEISEEEAWEIEYDLDAIIKNVDIPTPIRQKLAEISTDENMTFDDVKLYLNKVSIETLRILEKDVDEIISASGAICEAEKVAKQVFVDYLEGRENE